MPEKANNNKSIIKAPAQNVQISAMKVKGGCSQDISH
jgi:hypothetical protein